jgi:phenylpropionate dioxygenase-like ring-hydroxylating dioxygenase large terminal subunit
MLKTFKTSAMAYQGYNKRRKNVPDKLITDSSFGTPLAEFMRGFWQPVTLAEQVSRVPKKIKIFGEDLVVFRDGLDRVGLMQLHCAHRGASLEFGITQERGIRCCYHGIQFDVTGEVLDIPSEKDRGARLATKICQPAYPTIERNGLIFAFFGDPQEVPAFEEWDAFSKDDGVTLVPFTNVFPCNWLQVLENIADQIHTATLHQPRNLYDGEVPSDLNFDEFTLPAFGAIPELSYHTVREDSAMAFVAGRRMNAGLVWWRINECVLPNLSHHAYLFEKGDKRRLFHRVHMSRWYVPVDNENSIIFGWRMFGEGIDPENKGDVSKLGDDSIDFLGGQVGGRSYQDRQRLPGDFEAITSQGAVASHTDENPLTGDIGVYAFRKILRAALSGENPRVQPSLMHKEPEKFFSTYTQNTLLNIPCGDTEKEDADRIGKIGKKIIALMDEAQSTGEQRATRVVSGLEKLEEDFRVEART